MRKLKDCDVSQPQSRVEPPPRGSLVAVWTTRENKVCLSDRATRTFTNVPRRHATNGVPGAIFTGSPGIGKSARINYAVVCFLQDGYSIVLQRPKLKDYFLFQQDGQKSLHHRETDYVSHRSTMPDTSVYWYDPTEIDLEPLESNVFTIVASSPQEKHYKGLRKCVAAGKDATKMRNFPCWSLEELELGKPVDLNHAFIESKWRRFGGIPRYV
jgi:hypothetical protein